MYSGEIKKDGQILKNMMLLAKLFKKNYQNSFLVALLLSSCHQSFKENIDDIIETGPFNGVIMIYQANIPLYVRAFGVKDLQSGKPLDLDDQFMIGSITKQITAITALKNDVSVHDLLTHTSGIANSPKGEFAYSSQGYLEIAKICEHKTGRNFDVLLNSTLKNANIYSTTFQPQNTKFTWSQLLEIAPKLVMGHDDRIQNPYMNNRIIEQNSSGGLISTARDLMRWNEALYEKKIWGEKTTDVLTYSHINFLHRWGNMSYGYGIQILNDEKIEYSHNGIINSFLSTLIYYPQSKIHVVILENILHKNIDGSVNFQVHDKIRNIVRSRFIK